MSSSIRVLLVDDDALVRSGLRMMLAGAERIEVVGEADDGRGVLAAVDLHRPDVVLMDIRMPQLDGVAATRLLRAQPAAPAVVVLTTFDADELVLRALRAGAAGERHTLGEADEPGPGAREPFPRGPGGDAHQLAADDLDHEAATVLLVDDDALVRSGLKMMLAGAERIEVVGEVDDGRGVLAAVDAHHPDVVLMDIRMPQLDGIAATGLLRAQPNAPAVLVLTTFDADELVLRALRAGAAGFLLKDTPPAEIVRAIELVGAGDGMLSPTVTRRLIALVAGDPDAEARHESARARFAALSAREQEVALAVGRGLANADIAAELFMSVATVKAHVSRLLTKLGVDNRVQIALLVQEAHR